MSLQQNFLHLLASRFPTGRKQCRQITFSTFACYTTFSESRWRYPTTPAQRRIFGTEPLSHCLMEPEIRQTSHVIHRDFWTDYLCDSHSDIKKLGPSKDVWVHTHVWLSVLPKFVSFYVYVVFLLISNMQTIYSNAAPVHITIHAPETSFSSGHFHTICWESKADFCEGRRNSPVAHWNPSCQPANEFCSVHPSRLDIPYSA